MRMLAPALRRNARDRPLEDLQERLLDALARHVARDRRVVGLSRDLVDLVDVDDPGLGLLDVEVRGLDELEEDVLDVLTDVAGLGERGRVGDRERDVEDARERLREQRLAAPRRAEQQDVRLLQLDLVVVVRHLDALVVVVDRDRQPSASPLPARRRSRSGSNRSPSGGEVVEVELCGRRELLVDDLVTEIDALVADVDARARDQFFDLALALPAEAAEKLLVTVGRAGHVSVCTSKSAFRLGARRP